MKITDVTLTPIRTWREHGWYSPHVIVQLDTDEGAVGIGEMSDYGHIPTHETPHIEPLTAALKEVLLGRDPFDLAPILTQLSGANTLILCGVDLALHDLQGKALGRPVYELLGGKIRDRIPVCYPIFPQKAPADIEHNLQRVANLLEMGHDMIRIYIGVNLELDEAFLDGLRGRFGSRVRIKSLDMSGRLYWKTALQTLRRFSQYDFILAESVSYRQDLEGMAYIRRQVNHPISEHVGSPADALRMIQAGAIDIMNISLSSLGGIYHARKIYHMAEAAGLSCLIGTTQELSIGTAGQAHLGAAMPNLQYPSDPTGPILYQQDVVSSPVVYEHSHLLVQDGPGLGLEIDPELLQELRSDIHLPATEGVDAR